LPRGYETAGWRVVDADALWTIEQPIYVAERERLRAETRAQQRAAREAERAAGRR
jgi:alkylated DNA nucleotide flippase Atl1